MKRKTVAIMAVSIMVLTTVVVYSAEAVGIPKRAISPFQNFAESDLPSTTVFTDVAKEIVAAITIDSLTLGGDENANSHKITNLAVPTLGTDAARAGNLGIIGSLPTTSCNNNQILKYTTTGSAWTCTDLTSGITSLNSQSGPAINVVRQPGYITITNSTNQIQIGVDSKVVVTDGSAQTFSKNLDFGTSQFDHFGNTAIKIRNPANTFYTNLVGGAVSANQTLNLPAITTSDTIATLTRINGNSGAAGNDMTWQTLSSDSSSITSTTPTVVMTTTGVGAGTWHFKYLVIYQSTATGTGIGIAVNHSGSTGTFVMDWYHVTTGTTAATGIGDQVSSTNAGQLVEGKSERVKNTITSDSAGVDTANANIEAIVDGVVVVTGSGNLELKAASETGTAVLIKAGTILELNKIN